MLFNTFHLLEEMNEFHFGESRGKKVCILFRTHIQCARDMHVGVRRIREQRSEPGKEHGQMREWRTRDKDVADRSREWDSSKNLVFTLHISIFTRLKRIQTGKWMENNIFMNMTISLLIMWPGHVYGVRVLFIHQAKHTHTRFAFIFVWIFLCLSVLYVLGHYSKRL